jgi:sugar phosphate isomerase/epimerase
LELFQRGAPFAASELLGELGFASGGMPAEEAFPFAVQHGFRWLEVATSSAENFPDRLGADRIRAIRELADRHQVRLGLHTASFVNTAEVMPGVREAVLEHLLDQVRLGGELGCEYAVIHLGYHFSSSLGRAWAAIVETVQRMVELAERLDLPLLVENMNPTPREAEIHYFAVHADELARLFEAVPSSYLGLSVDAGHSNMQGLGIEPLLDAFPTRIANLGLSDNFRRMDDHLALGDGTLDSRRTLEALASRGHRVPVTIEVPGPEKRLRSLFHLRAALA